jgi:hypothetical protein
VQCLDGKLEYQALRHGPCRLRDLQDEIDAVEQLWSSTIIIDISKIDRAAALE